jgi:cytoskeletal protein CcmA (bactofilin family)
MTCPSEAVLATHADGELPPEVARQTEAHLGGCSPCRGVLEALRGEGRLLTAVLDRDPAGPAAEGAAPWMGRVTLVLLAFVAAAGIQAAWSWLGSLGAQTPVDVVDERSIVLSALFEAFFFLLREGASMLTSLLNVIAAVLVVVAAGVALSFWRRRTPSVLLLAALVAVAASPSFALEQRHEHKGAVMVPAGETLDDSLLAAGDTVAIDGVVTGNVLAFGRRVSVRGTVKGDLVTFAQRVDVEGSVEGNILDFSEDFTARGPVTRSLHAFAKHVGIEKEARIQGDAITFSQEADIEGDVGRDLLAFAGIANLRGNVVRNASAWTGHLHVEAPAKVGGNLTAHVDKAEHVSVDSGVTVVGKTETRIGEKGKATSHRSRYLRPGFYLWKLVWLAAAFLAGLVLQRLMPSLFPRSFGDSAEVAKSLGVGFLAFAAPPVAVVILGLTLVGLPLALLTLGVWLASLYLSGIVVGALVGRLLMSRRDAPPPPFALALVVGLLAVTVVGNVPYLGAIVRSVVVLLGLGAIVAQLGRAWRARLRPEVAVAP